MIEHEDYRRLRNGTLVRKDQSPFDYAKPYWGSGEHSTIEDQIFNVNGFKSDIGETKADAVLRYVVGSSLLEIGCAPGALLKMAADSGMRAEGIEPCSEHIDFVRNYSGCQVYCGMFEDIQMLPTYDTIVAMDVLEHVPNPEAFMEKAMSLLNPDGRIVLTLPAIYDDGEFDMKNCHPEHLNLFSQKHLKKWLNPTVFDRWVVGHEIVVVEK